MALIHYFLFLYDQGNQWRHLYTNNRRDNMRFTTRKGRLPINPHGPINRRNMFSHNTSWKWLTDILPIRYTPRNVRREKSRIFPNRWILIFIFPNRWIWIFIFPNRWIWIFIFPNRWILIFIFPNRWILIFNFFQWGTHLSHAKVLSWHKNIIDLKYITIFLAKKNFYNRWILA